jgi:hypothetical protein
MSEELRKLLKEIENEGCSCDAMHGYTCGIHAKVSKLNAALAEKPAPDPIQQFLNEQRPLTEAERKGLRRVYEKLYKPAEKPAERPALSAEEVSEALQSMQVAKQTIDGWVGANVHTDVVLKAVNAAIALLAQEGA